MSGETSPTLLVRVLQSLGLRKLPPDIGVRQPRQPVPSAPGDGAALEPPEAERDQG